MFKLKSKFQKIVFITIALGASVVSFSQQRPPNPVPCFGIGVGVCEQAQENTYYVSTSGDNEAAGGFNSPWRTLNHAISQVSPGDTILVANGTYEGFRNFNYSGEEGSPITLKANGTSVILDRGLSGNRDIIELNGVSHFVVDGFEIRNASRAGIAIIDTDYISIRNNDIGPNQIWGILTGFATHLEILNNRTFDSSEQHGIYVSNSRVANDNAIIKGNVVYGNHQNGIQVNGDCEVGGDGVITDSIIEGNRVYDNGWKGLSLISFADSIVRNNIIYDNGQRGGAGGIHLTNQPNCNQPSNNNAVYNNTIYEPNIAAVRITDDARDNKLFNNIAISSNTFADEVGANQIDSTSNIGRSSPSGLFLDFDNRNFELSATSAALNTGRESYSGVTVSSFDYRGSFRPNGGSIDVGAVEVITGSNVVDNSSGGDDTVDPIDGSGGGGSTSGDDTSGSTGVVDTGGSTGGGDTSGSTGGGTTTRPAAIPGSLVFLNSAMIEKLKGKLERQEAPAVRFLNAANAEANGANQHAFPAWSVALLYQLTDERRYCDFAVHEIEEFVQSEEQMIANGGAPRVAFDSYLYIGEHIGELTRVYDWCREFVTASQGQRWMAYANQAVANVWDHRNATWGGRSYSWSGWSTSNPMNNYHYSFLEATMLTGLVQRETSPTDAQRWMDKFRQDSIQDLIVPAFSEFSGGGSPEGTSYGDAMRTLFTLYDWWEQSTGEKIHDLTQHTFDSLQYGMHSVVPTLDYVTFLGDHARESTSMLFDYNRHYLLMAAELNRGTQMAEMSKDFLNKSSKPEMRYTFMYVYDFLYEDVSAPVATIDQLPNYYYAEAAGNIFKRDSWANDSSYLTMSFGPRVESHDHMDKGSFQIFKGDWLAYTQNINTRNGLNASTEFYNIVRFNSGNSVIDQPWTHWDDVNSIRKPGTRPNIVKVEDNDIFTHIALDLAPLYESPDISTYWRELIFIRPGVTVVFDYTVTTIGISKTWQLNSPYRPSVSGSQATISGPQADMTVRTLLPANATASIHDWSGDSRYQASYTDSSDTLTTGYRMDVSSSNQAETFLNIIDTEGLVESATVSVQNDESTLSLKLQGRSMMTFTFQNCCTAATIN